MPLFMLGFMVIAGVATVAAMKLWFDISQLRADVQRLSRTQDALIDIVSFNSKFDVWIFMDFVPIYHDLLYTDFFLK